MVVCSYLIANVSSWLLNFMSLEICKHWRIHFANNFIKTQQDEVMKCIEMDYTLQYYISKNLYTLRG